MSSPRQLRVAIVAPPYYELPPRSYGGIELVCHLLAEGLVDRGHGVTLVGAGDPQTRADFVATFPEPQPEGGHDAIRVELLHAARAARAIAQRDIDVVHDHTRLGPLMAAGRRVPTVVTVHGAVLGPGSCLEELDAVAGWVRPVAISAAQRRGAPHVAWAATVHNGISAQRYPVRKDKDEFVLYLGRISADKGVHLAVTAARVAGRRLVIAGSWTIPGEEEYFEATIRPVLGREVEWVGWVGFDDKIDLLGRAGCLLFPAQWHEPFGLVVVEAMACGTPVVALRRGAAPELVSDGMTGVVCESPDDLPQAIATAARLDPLACRAHVEASFTAERMVQRYEELYQRVAG
jgi:glycosyltransferase involved in cell wall biosynthesis